MYDWARPETPTPAPPPAPPPSRPPVPQYSYDDEDERAARRTMWLLAVGAGFLVLGLVVVFAVRSVRQENAARSAVSESAGMSAEDAARLQGGIGPAHGTDVPTYISARQAALASATGDRLAVVSLASYTTEDEARAVVGAAEVVALLAAAPGGEPEMVTTDLTTWVDEQTAASRAERDEIQKLIPTTDDPAFKSFYRAEVDRLNKLINGIDPDDEIVFAVVVRAPAPALQELGNKPEVRLVDVGQSADPGPRPDYRGLRPEETSRSNDPNTRPL